MHLPSRFRHGMRAGTRSHARGQSLVEFALLLPVFLLLLMFALDFGRIYLGWVNLQQMARIAANYAANNASAWQVPQDAAAIAKYRDLIRNDARAINCTLPNPIPDPVFASGTGLGDPVTAAIPCRFQLLTPIIGSVLGDEVLMSASATFHVKQGAIASVPGGGGGPLVLAPVADFNALPKSGYRALTVTFIDRSKNTPTSWMWDFGDGGKSFTQNPTHTYDTPGTYIVTLLASNSAGVSTAAGGPIEVVDPPTTGPVPEFSATPQSGPAPLTVTFKDLSTGGPTSWKWTFGDGGTSTSRNPSRTYNSPGTYDVTLEVSDGTTTNQQTKKSFVVVGDSPCIVPNFAGIDRKDAQKVWKDAGFTTSVGYSANGNYQITFQSLPGGMLNPPGLCAASITVGP